MKAYNDKLQFKVYDYFTAILFTINFETSIKLLLPTVNFRSKATIEVMKPLHHR